MNESRLWIGQSRPRHPERGDVTGSSQFYLHYRPGCRESISREMLVHGVASLHAACLLENERSVYEFGCGHNLDLPALIEARGTTVTTELVGPSVRMLLERSDLPVELTDRERAAIIVNTVSCAAPLAEAGLMPFDGHLHNWWVWLEDSLRGGSLDFRKIRAGDHSYTLVRGKPFNRPLWCSAEMPHFPPEARVFKRADEETFAAELRVQGFAGTTLAGIIRSIARLPSEHERRARRWQLERAYEEHRLAQQLEGALASGALDPHRMIQFCIASELLGMRSRPQLPPPTARVLEQCVEPLSRMVDPRPELRFASLADAATALGRCLPGPLPERSLHSWPAIDASWLIWDVRGGTDPAPAPTPSGQEATDRRVPTFEFGSPSGWGRPETPGPLLARYCEAFARTGRRIVDSPARAVARLVGRPAHMAVAAAAIVSLFAGIRLPQAPDEAASYQRQAQVERWMRQAVAADSPKSTEALTRLRVLATDTSNPEHGFTKDLIDKAFARVDVRHLGRPLIRFDMVTDATYPAERKRELRTLEVLAALGHEGAARWVKVLRAHDKAEAQSSPGRG